MMRRAILSFCLFPLFATAAPAAAPVASATAAAGLEAAVTQHLGADFSGVVLVRSAPGAAPLIRAYGMGNVEKNQRIVADTPFQIGSITKWLSAVAVLRLVDQGKLALDAPLKIYLPDMPAHIGAITLRQLLSNSAGIPNGVMQEFKKDKSIADLRLSHLDAARRYAGGTLLFEPGAGWEYSPTTWVVVAAIVEQASGKPFAQALDELVLRPALATSTAVPPQPFKDMPGAALAYKAGPTRELNMSPHIVYVAASGTVHSTAHDLLKLADAVYESPLLSAGARAELARVMVPAQNYALGGRVIKMQLGGRERVLGWQTGSTGGYKSLLAHVPGEGRTVVILNNTSMDQTALSTAAEAMLKAMY